VVPWFGAFEDRAGRAVTSVMVYGFSVSLEYRTFVSVRPLLDDASYSTVKSVAPAVLSTPVTNPWRIDVNSDDMSLNKGEKGWGRTAKMARAWLSDEPTRR